MANRIRASPNRFLLLYASQTGQAKAIAEEIADKAPQYGLKADLFCTSLIDKRFCLEKETCAVFVVSTSGDGEPPDTAVKFFRRLSRYTLSPSYLEKLNYALLALGDSNYIKFALFGRQLEQRLKSLSAKCFYETGYGDDAFGIETGVDPWVQNLWPALHKQLCITTNNLENKFDSKDLTSASMTLSTLSLNSKEEISLSKFSHLIKNVDLESCRIPKCPSLSLSISFERTANSNKTTFVPDPNFLTSQGSPLTKVMIIESKILTSGEDVKATFELTLKFQGEVVSYQPGDSFGIICCNPADEVDMLLNKLQANHLADLPVNIDLHKSFKNKRKLPSHIPLNLSLRQILLHCVEIRSVPKKILIRILAEYTENEDERRQLLFLCSQKGSDCYAELIRKPSLSVLDILMHFDSCKPPLEGILEYLPPLKPRFYSVASSPLVDEECFKIVFNVPKFEKTEGRFKERAGVCTGWLTDLSESLQSSCVSLTDVNNRFTSLSLNPQTSSIYAYRKQNHHFVFPSDLNCPIIMVGPGTGIAPFIGFLQHREKQMKVLESDVQCGETWIFYGCRYKEKDFLYKNELRRLSECGVLTHLVLSFSRDVSSDCDNTHKYVQDNIKQYSEKLIIAVKDGAKIFVCGDAKHMARDVQQAFIEVFEKGLDLNHDEAKLFVEKLQQDHQYVTDVWA